MASGTTRKFSLRDDDHPESSMAARTRPRLEIDPINYSMPLPPPPPPPLLPLHGDQDLYRQPDLNLSLFIRPSPPSPQRPQLPPPLIPDNRLQLLATHPINAPQPLDDPQPLPLPQPVVAPAPRRNRRNPTQAPRLGKSPTIQPPFPWATDHRATVHTLEDLLERGINTISGDVQCKRCERRYQMEYDLKDKFREIASYVGDNKYKFCDRAPASWMNPTLPSCKFCNQENSMKPVMAEKKKWINWLFLLLGQMLGCCTLEQLKYFCKHTKNHRTGAKDRVLFLTYLGLCKQLDPSGPFERS